MKFLISLEGVSQIYGVGNEEVRRSEYPTNRKAPQSLQENAITVFGPWLYNPLLNYLRDVYFKIF